VSSLAALVGFLLLSAPGLVYEAVRERCRPAIEHTPLREASRITLASIVFTGLAAAILAVIRLVSPAGTFPSPGKWITSPTYPSNHWLLATWTVLIGVVLACCLAALGAWLLHHGAAKMRPQPVLWLTTRAVRPKPDLIMVQAKLSSGNIYSGRLAGIDYVGEPETRMIALESPLHLQTKGNAWRPVEGLQRLVLGISQVETMAFSFHKVSGSQPKKHWCLHLKHV
jgi:hypothetical protein